MVADSRPNLYVRLQYIQDKQEVTLNDRFGVAKGPEPELNIQKRLVIRLELLAMHSF
jgi:hypothetical protein